MSDPLLLSRIQFAANITFHILFPAISIALAWVLLFFKTRYNKTRDRKWLSAYQLWVKIFALTFAVGIVTGVTMSFQFGTNWPGFMNTVGNIAGPLLGYEVLTAFFLEATFLGIMLFGTGRVSDGVQTLATLLVAFGTSLSAFWIIALDSWMQTPAAYTMIDGKAHVTSWIGIIFTPSMPYRLVHMMLASGLTVAFLVAGVSAYRWRRGDKGGDVMAALKTGVYLAAVLVPLQIFAGDLHGLNTLKYQPAKIAAIEGVWNTGREVPLLLFGMPSEKDKANHHTIEIPRGASYLLTHDPAGEIKGINAFPDHPPVAPMFWSFRIMVGVGILMLLISWAAAWQLKYGTLGPRMGRILAGSTFIGWAGVVAGWYVTEIGRQPFLVYGLLRTADAVTAVPGTMIAASLTMYLVLYAVLGVAYVKVVFYLARRATSGDKSIPPEGYSSAAVVKAVKGAKL